MKILIVVGSFNVFLALDIYIPLLYLHDYLITVLLLIILSTINSENFIFTGILENQISDDQEILINTVHRPPPSKSKYITIYNNSDASKDNFRMHIHSLNLYATLDNHLYLDLNRNYEIIENAITNSMNIYLTKKVVKFNKKKHPKKLDYLWYSKFCKSQKQTI